MNEAAQIIYHRFSKTKARLTLLAAAAFAGICVAITLSPAKINQAEKIKDRPGDADLYAAEIRRMRQGWSYYEAARLELVARGYPTKSVFNWRTPLPMWALAQLPDPLWGKYILCGLGFLAVALAFDVFRREQSGRYGAGLLAALLLVGPILPMRLSNFYTLPVHWAGSFIAISILLYALNRRGWAVAAGLAAVFVRELGLLYCLLCLALAIWERRHNEIVAWLVGLTAWAGFFCWHAWQVRTHMPPYPTSHLEGWVQFNGLPFLIAAAQMNALLLLSPQWLTGLYLTLGLLAIGGWRSVLGIRTGATVLAYLAVFAIVGQEFNQYWGILIAQTLCFAVAQAPYVLAVLLSKAGWLPPRLMRTAAATATG